MVAKVLALILSLVNVILVMSFWPVYVLTGWLIVTDEPQSSEQRLKIVAILGVMWLLWIAVNLLVFRWLRTAGVTSIWTYLLPLGALYSLLMLLANAATAING